MNEEPNNNIEVEKTRQTSPGKGVLYLLAGIVIIAAVAYGATKMNKDNKPSSDYKLSEIDQLEEQKQRDILEDQLAEYTKKAQELAPDAQLSDRYTIYIKLAELQNRTGRYLDAIDSVNKVAEERPGTSRIWSTFAESYVGLKDLPKAKENILKAIAIDDENAEYWQIYFRAFADASNEELSAKYVEALSKTNNNIELVKGYAVLLEKMGDKPKAIAYWETARNVDPNNAATYEGEINRLRQ